jgi:hypothetical protein
LCGLWEGEKEVRFLLKGREDVTLEDWKWKWKAEARRYENPGETSGKAARAMRMSSG